MNMDWLPALVGATVILRGLGAGTIFGVVLITLPTRRRLGVVAYARFTRAHYEGPGVKVYGLLTGLGALLTVLVFVLAVAWSAPPSVTWAILASLVTTSFGFVGTARALPAMTGVRQASDEDTTALARYLDRFARWGMFSACCHIIAFSAIVTALALLLY